MSITLSMSNLFSANIRLASDIFFLCSSVRFIYFLTASIRAFESFGGIQ